MEIEALKTKNYKEIIQVNVPIRFYWDEVGFDGIEFGPFKEELLPWQDEMLLQCLDAVTDN